MSHRIVKTVLDSAGTQYDPSDVRDITGNGFADIVFAENDGRVYWLNQTSQGVFSARLTINSSTIASASVEGLMWIDVDDDGDFEVVAVDQANGCLYLFKMDTPGTPTGTWTRSTILTSRPTAHDCRAWDLDNDGIDEIVYTHRGQITGGAGDGAGVRWMKFTGSDVTNPAHYTHYLICEQPAAHHLCRDRVTIGGVPNCIAFSSRLNGAASGLYYAAPASPVTNVWTKTALHTTTDGTEWTHLDWGDFFGNGNVDFVIQCNTAGGNSHVAVIDAANSWAKTTVLSGDSTATQYNCLRAGYQWRSRDAILVSGSSKFGVCEWDGTTWQRNDHVTGHDKMDGKIFSLDVDGDGQVEYVGACSPGNVVSFKVYQQPVAPALGFLDNLISVWKCNEASGDLLDAYGSNHATDTNTVGSTTGKIGNARDFVSASTEWFTLADNASISMGAGQSFLFALLFQVKGTTANMEFLQKVADNAMTAATAEYRARFGNSNDNVLWSISNGTTTTSIESTVGDPTIVANTWYVGFFWYDATTGRMGCQVNSGIPIGAAHSSGAQNGTNDLGFGGNIQQLNGLMDQIVLAKRYWNDEERRTFVTQVMAGNDFPSLVAARPAWYYRQMHAQMSGAA